MSDGDLIFLGVGIVWFVAVALLIRTMNRHINARNRKIEKQIHDAVWREFDQ